MVFRSLTLKNFGTYAGSQRLDLRSTPETPVVLIGGANGAGKTTILEAILLCLHGKRALGPAVSAATWRDHLVSRIHRPSEGGDDEGPREASITLSLTHTEGGHEHEYVVERSWRQAAQRRGFERLRLTRDGSPVDDVPESAWQDFLDALVPPGVAGLFLFDGEKIQELAEDETGEQLSDAIHRLMGLDVVHQLRADLTTYAAKTGKGRTGALDRKLSDAARELGVARQQYEDLVLRRAGTKARLDELAARAERARARFAQQGGLLASDREKLEARERRASAKVAASEAELRMLIAGLLPFALCTDLAKQVADRLERERAAEEDEVVEQRLRAAKRRLQRRLAARDSDASAYQVLERLLLSGEEQIDRLHDVTPTERAQLLDQLDQIARSMPARAAEVRQRLVRASEARARARKLLDRMPEDSEVAPLLEALMKAERAVGSMEAELAQIEDELSAARHQVEVRERELRRAREQLHDSDLEEARARLALRTASLLDEFSSGLRERKLEAVELETARFFNRLSRKGGLLSGVKVDPETFQVELTRWDGAHLPKARLSAGEKQLFAISVLWALAKISGRALPVVVDTPLARLDHHHRHQLLREYFPHVSHQVIVLSTDTEVDLSAAHGLAGVTARQYRLDHDNTACVTTVVDGYFDGREELADAR